MREYIFIFEQKVARKLGLKLADLLLLDYLFKFFNSSNVKKKKVNGKWYLWVTYNKILSDLPILGIKERQLRNMIVSLEQKQIIKRLDSIKNHLMISVDWDLLGGNDLPENEKHSEEVCCDNGNILPAIENKNNKKYLIINSLDSAKLDNKFKVFNDKFHEKLKLAVSKISYETYLKTMFVFDREENDVLFYVDNLEFIKRAYYKQIEKAFLDAMQEFSA